MAIPTNISEVSATAASNSPAGTDTIGTSGDDWLRAIQAVLVAGLSHKGSDIASAATADLGAVAGLMHDITGVTTISSFGTVRAGVWKILKFEGALTLTHNATSLILLGAENHTTADGDVGIYISEGSGNWRELAYFPVAINPAKSVSTDETQTLTNKTLTAPAFNGALSGDAIAAQAEMETGTATDSIVSPGRQHFHPSAAKGWVWAGVTGSAVVSYNVTSITDGGTGNMTVNWGTDFSTGNFAPVASIYETANTLTFRINAIAAGTTQILAYDLASNLTDPNQGYFVAAFGDHA